MLQAGNSVSGSLKTSMIHGNTANRSNETQIPGPTLGPLDQNCWSWAWISAFLVNSAGSH